MTYREKALSEIDRRLAELEPFVSEEVKEATRVLVEQYREALNRLAQV